MVIKSKKNVLYCRVGWMDFYNLELCPFDKINGGGDFPNEGKYEVYNFQNLNERYYGFVQIPTDRSIDIKRLNAKSSDYADDVLVIWYAKNPKEEKNVIVGIYDEAIVYREYQHISNLLMQRRLERKVDIFNIVSKKAILFTTQARNIEPDVYGRPQNMYGDETKNEKVIKELEKIQL